MVVRVETGQVLEDVIIATHRLLSLHSTGTIVPGIIDENLAVMEADAEDKVVVALYPAHHGLHLLGPTSEQLIVWSPQIPPAWELSVEVEVVHVGPQLGLVTVRVDGGQEVNLRCVEQLGDLLVIIPALTQVTTQTWLKLPLQFTSASTVMLAINKYNL